MYNGEKWVSDFVQRRFWPNTAYENDYRHGTRRVYHNGKELFLYRKEGRILGSEIKKHLK